ncbi:MAG: DUF4114 domain-containing protein [Polyangiales bacterium]
MRAFLGWTVALLAALVSVVPGEAVASVKQPDGTVVPTPVADLQGVFTANGDPTIDPVVDAQVVPETFKPACSIKFNLISRGGAAYKNIFGWYNVTGSKPPVSDLHVILDCSAAPKSVDTAIRKDPAYKGGDIGFFLVTPENGSFGMCPSLPDNIGSVGGGSKNAIYYSEAALNPDSTAASKHVHLLIYDSKAFKPAFYFAWEDLYAGGDNEFTDLVARVDNIVCAAAGESCDTGKLGICKLGAKSCVDGMVVCKDAIAPGAKKCNGLDNDCDGKIDDGPCPDGTICTRGACIPKCGSGEFKCTGGLVCDMGICVVPSCVGKTCPDGQTCVEGACVDACTGVTCPSGKVCRVGVCVDPCDGISCGTDEVCEKGVCVAACTCGGCTDKTKACDTTSKHCVDAACVGKSCAAGTHCASGTCVDDCMGAVCPAGQTCTAGKCVGTMGGDAGTEAGTDGGTTEDASLDFDTGADDASAPFDGGGMPLLDDGKSDGGCGCRTTGSSTTWPSAVFLGLAIATIRRKKRSITR